MKIRYFDLGLFKGTELSWMENILSKFTEDYEMYGFEACKIFYNNIINEKYFNYNKKRTKIYNLAVTDKNQNIRLYHHKNKVGHSIYDTKQGIGQDYEEVKGIKFSSWLKENNINLKESFNILRINIEGAEYDFFNDIIRTEIYKDINIFCGDGKDCSKVHELVESGKAREHHKLKKRLGIKIHRFVNFKKERNVNLEEIIEEKIKVI